jgi:threonine synthase
MLWLKDEAGNPTHSFKARGLALAINGAIAYGKRSIALPTAGNAGPAAAAYAAAAGLRCRVTMPESTPEAFVLETLGLGAEVKRVPGTIADAGRELATWAPAPNGGTSRRSRSRSGVEGKKTWATRSPSRSGGSFRKSSSILPAVAPAGRHVAAFLELAELGWTRTRCRD